MYRATSDKKQRRELPSLPPRPPSRKQPSKIQNMPIPEIPHDQNDDIATDETYDPILPQEYEDDPTDDTEQRAAQDDDLDSATYDPVQRPESLVLTEKSQQETFATVGQRRKLSTMLKRVFVRQPSVAKSKKNLSKTKDATDLPQEELEGDEYDVIQNTSQALKAQSFRIPLKPLSNNNENKTEDELATEEQPTYDCLQNVVNDHKKKTDIDNQKEHQNLDISQEEDEESKAIYDILQNAQEKHQEEDNSEPDQDIYDAVINLKPEINKIQAAEQAVTEEELELTYDAVGVVPTKTTSSNYSEQEAKLEENKQQTESIEMYDAVANVQVTRNNFTNNDNLEVKNAAPKVQTKKGPPPPPPKRMTPTTTKLTAYEPRSNTFLYKNRNGQSM